MVTGIYSDWPKTFSFSEDIQFKYLINFILALCMGRSFDFLKSKSGINELVPVKVKNPFGCTVGSFHGNRK